MYAPLFIPLDCPIKSPNSYLPSLLTKNTRNTNLLGDQLLWCCASSPLAIYNQLANAKLGTGQRCKQFAHSFVEMQNI